MKTVNPSISIIVPIYKVEKYLNRCLDSILAQTFTDWECILIDDGSPPVYKIKERLKKMAKISPSFLSLEFFLQKLYLFTCSLARTF